jgi:hypothetical protein
METFYNNLNSFFHKQLKELRCDENTKAYIVSVLEKFKTSASDYSKDSITILYSEAKFRQDFYTFQNIGDWLFMCNSLFPEHLNNASLEYYQSIGRLSYYSCYRLINYKWKVYETLADLFVPLSEDTRIMIRRF